MPWGCAIDCKFASVVDTTCPLLSARFTIWLLVLTWLTGMVKIVCVAIPERKHVRNENEFFVQYLYGDVL